jgi:hypothetical protein
LEEKQGGGTFVRKGVLDKDLERVILDFSVDIFEIFEKQGDGSLNCFLLFFY